MFFGSSKSFRAKCKMRSSVHTLIGLTRVTPELVAYAACQVSYAVFQFSINVVQTYCALSSMHEWVEKDRDFSLSDFYSMILDKFLVDEDWGSDVLKTWNE